jgi:hypothetical protein
MSVPAEDLVKYFDLGHQGDVDMTQIEKLLTLTPSERVRRHEGWRHLRDRTGVIPNFVAVIAGRLSRARVEFIIVGGVCGILHGSPYITPNIDICYRPTPDNIRALTAALASLRPVAQFFPDGPECAFDPSTVQFARNLRLVMGAETLILLAEVPTIGEYEQVLRSSVELEFGGHTVKTLSLPALVALKERAGRPKDLLVLTALRPMLIAQLRRGSASDG